MHISEAGARVTHKEILRYYFVLFRIVVVGLLYLKDKNWETRQERNHKTKSLNLFKDLMPISNSYNSSTFRSNLVFVVTMPPCLPILSKVIVYYPEIFVLN